MSSYDAWKTDPEYGLSNRELLRAEERRDRAEEKAAKAEILRTATRTILTAIRPLIAELAEIEASGPAFELVINHGDDRPPVRLRQHHGWEELQGQIDELLAAEWEGLESEDYSKFMAEGD